MDLTPLEQEIADQNLKAPLVSREEIRMLLGQWQDRGHNRRLHQKSYSHANRRVGKEDRRA